MRVKKLLAVLAAATVALAGCAVGHSGQSSEKPTIRLGYQSFPSGDLIVKNNKWLEEALPDYNIKWTKFDSGADVNTAFVAKELDFGALGSSPVARGLSAPLNIPYRWPSCSTWPVTTRRWWHVTAPGSTRSPTCGASGSPPRSRRPRTTACWPPWRRTGCRPAMFSLAAWERGDIAAAYSWLPTLDQLRKTGKDLITSRQLAKDGKPTLDLAAVSDEFSTAHPEVVDIWRQQQARALDVIKNDPQAAANAIAAEVGLSPEDVAGQLKQGVYLTPAQVASPEWLGTDGAPGNLAANLQNASQFLADQKQIPEAAPLQTFQNAIIYTKGLPDVIAKQ